MIRAGILGASGYTGVELVRLLQNHPEVNIEAVTSRSYAGSRFAETFGSFLGVTGLVFEEGDAASFAERCDVLFLALPHGIASGEIQEELLDKTVVIDLGADFRLRDSETYHRWYGIAHKDPHLLESAVYGLSELAGERIRESNLIANPGCYTTCSILALAPLLASGKAAPSPVIVNALSGVSGAGRKASAALHFAECNESAKAYGIGTHRHTPEIEEALSEAAGEPVTVQFTPHLIPMNRGILSTCYTRLRGDTVDTRELLEEYRRFYRERPFVRILPEGSYPETRWVRGSNRIDIAVMFDQRSGLIVAVGAIDNLMKGAAGQAVQNMNIRFGFDERTGLEQTAVFP
jgi:N-acetyl-gamma-glutamyl-phosphate reductase